MERVRLDPDNRFIAAIRSHMELDGKDILEVGCGSGRITRDLARLARRVVATDPDGATLDQARSLGLANVAFRQLAGEAIDFPVGSFDLAVYPLSLHHVPPELMVESLRRAGRALRPDGVVIIIEPAEGGSLIEAKERFGAGSGDERAGIAAARRAMGEVPDWQVTATDHFRTAIWFADEAAFLERMLPHWQELPPARLAEIRAFLTANRTSDGIRLEAGRRLDLLRREKP